MHFDLFVDKSEFCVGGGTCSMQNVEKVHFTYFKLWIRFDEIPHVRYTFDLFLTFRSNLKLVHQTLYRLSDFTKIRVNILKRKIRFIFTQHIPESNNAILRSNKIRLVPMIKPLPSNLSVHPPL